MAAAPAPIASLNTALGVTKTVPSLTPVRFNRLAMKEFFHRLGFLLVFTMGVPILKQGKAHSM